MLSQIKHIHLIPTPSPTTTTAHSPKIKSTTMTYNKNDSHLSAVGKMRVSRMREEEWVFAHFGDMLGLEKVYVNCCAGVWDHTIWEHILKAVRNMSKLKILGLALKI